MRVGIYEESDAAGTETILQRAGPAPVNAFAGTLQAAPLSTLLSGPDKKIGNPKVGFPIHHGIVCQTNTYKLLLTEAK